MVEAFYPSTNELIRQAQTKRTVVMVALIATVALCFSVAGAAICFTRMSGMTAGLLAFVAGLAILLPVAIIHNPRIGVYCLVASALLFAGLPGNSVAAAPTSFVPVWWNISIIGQTFGKTTAINSLVFSPAELIMIVTTVAWVVRGIVSRNFKIRGGPILPWILPYIGMVVFGYVNGWVRGGDPIIGLWEVRAQFQFLLMFVLAANLITKREHATALLWMIAFCCVIQAVFGAISYSTLSYDTTHDAIHGLGHEDSLFFNYMLLFVMLGAMCGGNKKLTLFSLATMPVILFTIAVNQRRAGIGALVLAMIPMVPLAWTLVPHRRAQIRACAIAIVLVCSIYLPAAWNSDAGWAFGARAIRSASDPNSRDAQSNAYRDIENGDLKFTRNLQPWTGIGYGRPFVRVVGLPDIAFPLRDYLPHNTLLWVWMRLGHFGFLALMMIFAASFIHGPQLLRRVRNPGLKLFGIIAILNMLMLFVYGKYDLQFVSGRTMTLSAILLGVLSVLPTIDASSRTESDAEEQQPDEQDPSAPDTPLPEMSAA